jgi:HD-like signal output (HDOD) protein
MEAGVSKAFEFVRQLVTSLPGQKIDLPAFPEVVRRLQVLLAQPDTTAKDLAPLIESEPVLSAHLLQMANSAALNAAGNQVTTVKAAINRLGFNLVRITAMVHALRQLEHHSALQPIRRELAAIWQSSIEVAVRCHTVARRVLGRQADEAMLAGLLHGIGALYILMQSQRADPQLRQDPAFAGMVADWHPAIGKAILDGWGLPPMLGEAVVRQDDLLIEGSRDLDPLPLLVAAAKLHYRLGHDAGIAQNAALAAAALGNVRFAGSTFEELLAAGKSEMAEMRQLLAA